MFDPEVCYPPIEPSHHLVAANPGGIEAEQAQVGDRFKSGGGAAELAFAAEFQQRVQRLA
jgi:hypothetical protein